MFLVFAGLTVFLITIFSLKTSIEKYNIQLNGQVVKMQIEHLPQSCIGSKIPYFVTFSFKGVTYERKTRGDFCEKHYVGELVEMKMIKDSKYILFPNESALIDLISLIVLNFSGLILSITQWKKIHNEK